MKALTELEEATNTRTGEVLVRIYCLKCDRTWRSRMGSVAELVLHPNPMKFICEDCKTKEKTENDFTRENHREREAIRN